MLTTIARAKAEDDLSAHDAKAAPTEGATVTSMRDTVARDYEQARAEEDDLAKQWRRAMDRGDADAANEIDKRLVAAADRADELEMSLAEFLRPLPQEQLAR